jgi:hypothetical protein
MGKRILIAIGIAVLLAVLPQTASANDTALRYHRMLLDFRGFLQQYPDTAGALTSMPALAHDPAFLSSHQELQTYLQAHRPLVAHLKNHPGRIMKQIARLKR